MILVDFETPFEPSTFVGLAEGEAHVIDGARIHANDDAVQSLVTSDQQLGPRDWFVVRQTDSRQETAVDDVMHAFLAESLAEDSLSAQAAPPDYPGADGSEADGRQTDGRQADGQQHAGLAERPLGDWLTLSDPAMAVAADVLRIRNHPDLPADVEVHGYLYDRNGERLVRLDI